MSPAGDAEGLRKLVLLLLKSYGRPMERRAIHSHLYELSRALKSDLGFHERYAFSPLVERELDRMIAEGLLKRLYVVGPRFTELYREYLKLTEKGEEAAGQIEDRELGQLVADLLSRHAQKKGEEGAAEG